MLQTANHIKQSKGHEQAGTFFQPKLSVNQPGDVYEQEADAMADKVMRMGDTPSTQPFFKPSYLTVQRKCQHCEEEEKKIQRKEINGDVITGISTEHDGNTDGNIVQRKSADPCVDYTTGERDKSFTEDGIQTDDVTQLPDGRLLLADFGVDWRHVKKSLATNPLLQGMIAQYEADKSYKIDIYGYTDCIGNELNNVHLRKGRAQNVFNLLGSEAKTRTNHTDLAEMGNYINDNSTAENRAKNRSVTIYAVHEMPPVTITGMSCKKPVKATSMSDYIDLVMCLETALSSYNPRQILSLLRQLYYSDASWTSCRGAGCSFFSDVITCGLSIPDPRPAIGNDLYNALVLSKEVDGIDVGHIFTGLESMFCPSSSVELEVPGPNFITDITNEEFATWAGDLGSAVAGKVSDEVDDGMPTQPWSKYFSTPGTLSSDEDMLGDIDSYVMRINLAGGTCAGSEMRKIPSMSTDVSQVLLDYYIANVGNKSGGLSTDDRIRCFVEAIGGKVAGKRIINAGTIDVRDLVRVRTQRFAADYYRLKYHHGYFAPTGIGSWISKYSFQVADLFIDWLEHRL